MGSKTLPFINVWPATQRTQELKKGIYEQKAKSIYSPFNYCKLSDNLQGTRKDAKNAQKRTPANN
jgi:hypothetical protein